MGQISAGNELSTLSTRDATSTFWTALDAQNAQSGGKEWSLQYLRSDSFSISV
jgi:hypothetical protein